MSRPALSPEILRLASEVFAERIPFNRVLGLEVDSITHDRASMRFSMRPDLQGNFVRAILHGGVISAALDATAGLAVYSSLLSGLGEHPGESEIERFARISTIDMRVDYLRPGTGTRFVSSARIVRSGSRIAVVHTEMHDDANALIASGTCTYLVG